MKILFTGDFAPVTSRLTSIIEAKRYQDVFNDFVQFTDVHDLNVTNLECPLVESGKPIDKVGPHLKGSLMAADALSWAGFDLVTLANNHIMDYGEPGLLSTLEACRNNEIATIGAGINLNDAAKPCYYTKGDITTTILNICEQEFNIAEARSAGANPIELIDDHYKIIEARKNADFVILVIHGGHEYYSLPSPKMQKLYRYYIDIGADVVIGHHPHCFSGYEEYNNGIIFYSLGNFVFDREVLKPPIWYKGYAVSLSLNKDMKLKYELIPYTQSLHEAGVSLMSREEEAEFKNDIEELNNIIKNPERLSSCWNEFVRNSYRNYIYRLLPTANKYIVAAFHKLNLSIPFSKKSKLRILNSIRCMSHNDIFIETLKKSIK